VFEHPPITPRVVIISKIIDNTLLPSFKALPPPIIPVKIVILHITILTYLAPFVCPDSGTVMYLNKLRFTHPRSGKEVILRCSIGGGHTGSY